MVGCGAHSLRQLVWLNKVRWALLASGVCNAAAAVFMQVDRLKERHLETLAAQLAAGQVAAREGREAPQAGELEARAEAAAAAELRRVAAAVRALNPAARVLPCERCRVPLEALLPEAPPPLQLVASPSGWHEVGASGGDGRAAEAPLADGLVELAQRAPADVHAVDARMRKPPAASGVGRGSATRGGAALAAGAEGAPASSRAHEEDEYGVGSITLESARPFHPRRLWALLCALADAAAAEAGEADLGGGGREQPSAAGACAEGGGEGGGAELPQLPCAAPALLRAKGMFWVASLPQVRTDCALCSVLPPSVDCHPCCNLCWHTGHARVWPIGHRPICAGVLHTRPKACGPQLRRAAFTPCAGHVGAVFGGRVAGVVALGPMAVLHGPAGRMATA